MIVQKQIKAYNLYVFSFLSERKNAYLEIIGIKYYYQYLHLFFG
ncbi:hypothetical protein I33_1547 [Bacillus subtilis subsp. subtilis str. RO-NN-1]|nr:hypothetical protein I33_1547 [Bacillus subtilis subsp. subtilis str. RO-NN-1]